MNSYILSRQWFDFAYENPSKVKPVHGCLYFWLIELANRLGWPSEFGSPGSSAMAACGISSYNTYKKAINDLTEFGFVEVKRKSINQYQSCIIALSIIDKAQYKALDKALSEHSTKHSSSTIQSTDSINKPQTINQKQQTPSGSEEPKAKSEFLELFNEITGRNFRGIDSKTERHLAKLKKAGFTSDDLKTAIRNGFGNSKKWHNPALFTPEYITREEKFLQFLNWEGVPEEKPLKYPAGAFQTGPMAGMVM